MKRRLLEPAYAFLTAWQRGLGIQLLGILLLVSCSLTVVASIYDYRIEEYQARSQLVSFGRSFAHQAALACPDAILVTDVEMLGAYVDELVGGERFVSGAAVLRPDGQVMVSNPRQGLDRSQPDTLFLEEPILVQPSGDRIGTFVLGVSLKPMRLDLEQKWTRLLWRASLGFLLIAVLFWVALRTLVLHPLHKLDVAVQRLGQGQLEEPLPDLGRSELGRLGRTMDEMRTNLQASYRSLAEQNTRLLELDCLKRQFLTNVSHEMRTPLTSIVGGIEMLGNGHPAAEMRETATVIQRNSTRLLDLVDQLLDLAKLESGNLVLERGRCQPDQVIEEACSRFQDAAADKSLQLRCDVAGLSGLSMMTDAARLRRIVATLVDNAVKFTPNGGRVDVKGTIAVVDDQSLLQIVVEDNGDGIPAEFLPRLFELFSQADGSLTRRHGGAGLGLAMARDVARLLGGDLEVTSEEGSGTRAMAWFAVPTAVANAPTETPQAALADAGTLTGRVLVVDDAPDNQRLLRAILTKAGLSVAIATNGQEALDSVATNSPATQYDLVLMDLQMPVLDGVSAIQILRDRGFDRPIVALTANAMAEDRQRCLDAGASGYELKPISRKKLLDVLAAHLNRSAS